MLTLRPGTQRGRADHGWLLSLHTFSFAQYHDPAHMGFRCLRVINEDRVQGGHGFDLHPHQDVEVLTYVLEGALEHQDSLGRRATIRAGEAQLISAGTGIAHSEVNASPTEETHFLQIWILPSRRGGEPAYHQATLTESALRNRLAPVASGDGREGSLPLLQDAVVEACRLDAGARVGRTLLPGRHAWVQVARGKLELQGQRLVQGDGAALSGERSLDIRAAGACEFLLFDLP